MGQGWLHQRQRGTLIGLQFMAWWSLHMGRHAARLLLYPICLYYLAFTARVQRIARIFLTRALGRSATLADVFRLYHCFASIILDRVYLLNGQYGRFNVSVRGAEIVHDYLARGKGCVLLGSHLGSFEIVRANALARISAEVKVLMYEEHAPMVGSIGDALNPDVAANVIRIGSPDAMLKVKECLERGGLVGILGDRVLRDEGMTICRFFDKDALFPSGPLRLTSVLKAPVILFFGLYRGGNRYEIVFELLADQIDIERSQRERQIQHWMQKYAKRLEHYCRLAPYNWFNLYDFWDEKP